MGRTELPVDPLAGPVAGFALELRKLRVEAGSPTYREMARVAEVSVATLSRAAAGRQLPSLSVVRAYVRACGQDPEPWAERWREAWEQVVAGRDEAGARPPYPGLAPFGAHDADLFFGREDLLARLRAMLGAHRLVCVAGPSGSGKSSLVRAGLVPSVAHAEVLTPGDRPARLLAERVCGPAPGSGRLVVVDQFEEAFTVCADPRETRRFVDDLLALAAPDGGTQVVLTVRGDHYGHCASHPRLAEALSAATLLVGPMTEEELRDAVIKPAAAVGLIVERELTSRVVADVAGRPGALPMLSHTLLEVWRRRESRALTLEAYERLGGVRGALATTAETLYTSLTPGQAAAARHILLRLVQPGRHGVDTRRPATPAEVDAADPDAAEALTRLTTARMVMITDGRIELAHEALIDGWPRLRDWIDTDRELLRHHRALTQATQTWRELGHDPGALYRGHRLALAEQLFAPPDRRAALTPDEAGFLDASISARDQEKHATRRAGRRVRALWATLAVLLLVAGTIGYAGLRTRQARDRESRLADARRVAALATATHPLDPVLAGLLAVAAYRLADQFETRSALLTAVTRPELPVITPPATASTYETLLTRDGATTVNLDDGRATIYRLADGHTTTVTVPPGHRALTDVSRDGQTLALTLGGTTTVWNATRGTLATLRGQGFTLGDSGLTDIRYDETSRTVIVDDLARHQVRMRLPLPSASVVVLGPADRYLAVCAEAGQLQLWAVPAPGGRPRRVGLADPARCDSGANASFSRDGGRVALAGPAGAGVWDTRTGALLGQVGGPAEQARLSPDGRFLLTRAGTDLAVWRVGDQQRVLSYRAVTQEPDLPSWVDDRTVRYLDGGVVRTLDLSAAPIPEPAATTALSADGSVTATVTAGYLVRFSRPGAATPLSEARLPITLPLADTDAGPGPLIALSADGGTAVLGVALAPGTVWQHRLLVWDVLAGRLRSTLELGDGDPVTTIAVSGDGSRVAVSRQLRAFDDTLTPTGLEAWDIARGRRLTRLPGLAPQTMTFSPDGASLATDRGLVDIAAGTVNGAGTVLPTDYSVTAAAFSPDGGRLAFDDIGGQLGLWDLTPWRLRATLRDTGGDSPWPLAGDGPSIGLAFSHDGRTLAAAHLNGIALWDVAGGRPLGPPIPVPGADVQAVAFAADDRTVLVAGGQTVRTIPIDPAALVTTLCARAGRDLTAGEWERAFPGRPRREVC